MPCAHHSRANISATISANCAYGCFERTSHRTGSGARQCRRYNNLSALHLGQHGRGSRMFTLLFQLYRIGAARIGATLLCSILLIPVAVRSDEPYARTRDYDLQNVRTHLWFDLDNQKIRGEAIETVSALRDGVAKLRFDSVALNIE